MENTSLVYVVVSMEMRAQPSQNNIYSITFTIHQDVVCQILHKIVARYFILQFNGDLIYNVQITITSRIQLDWMLWYHDDVIKWKHFPRYWPFVWGIHRSPVNSAHNGQWRGALMFYLICARINGWVNNREAGNLRPHRAHYDAIVMWIGV